MIVDIIINFSITNHYYITTKEVSAIPTIAVGYLIQLYVLKFVRDL